MALSTGKDVCLVCYLFDSVIVFQVRNATAVFIINLSVSDLMSCCFNLPLAASTFWRRSWRHGLLLCRLFPLLRYGLLAVSLFTVLAITINRYVMIGHPTMYPKWVVHNSTNVTVSSNVLAPPKRSGVLHLRHVSTMVKFIKNINITFSRSYWHISRRMTITSHIPPHYIYVVNK